MPSITIFLPLLLVLVPNPSDASPLVPSNPACPPFDRHGIPQKNCTGWTHCSTGKCIACNETGNIKGWCCTFDCSGSCWDAAPNLCYCHNKLVPSKGSHTMLYNNNWLTLLKDGKCTDVSVGSGLVYWIGSHYPFCPGTCHSIGYTQFYANTTVFFETQGFLNATEYTKPKAP